MKRVAVAIGVAVVGLPSAARAEEFSCAVQPDGKSVILAVTNPYKVTTSCTVHCEFGEMRTGMWFAECTREVAPGANQVLCTKVNERGKVAALTRATANCIKPLDPAEKSDDDDELPDVGKAIDGVRKGLPPEGQKVLDEIMRKK